MDAVLITKLHNEETLTLTLPSQPVKVIFSALCPVTRAKRKVASRCVCTYDEAKKKKDKYTTEEKEDRIPAKTLKLI